MDRSPAGHATPDPRQPAPTPPEVRHDLIDIVRGFALFGVMLANMVWTTQWEGMSFTQLQALPTAGIDLVAHLFTEILVDYKFYTLFSMLFGLGFALQMSRAAERGRRIISVYLRRLGILFIIGVAHMLLIWFGDVLHIYAVFGLLLIPLRSWSDRAIIRLAIAIALLSSLTPSIVWLCSIVGFTPPDGREGSLYATMAGGDLIAIWRMNLMFTIEEYARMFSGGADSISWITSVYWKFLVGMVVGRRLILQEPERFRSFFRRLLPWALGVGLSLNIVRVILMWAVDDYWDLLGSSAWSLLAVPFDVGVFALSIAYACILALLYVGRGRALVMPLAPLGRMALTNYLMQSVTIVVLFYGIGFGLVGKAGAAACLLICVTQYVAQIVFSAWWLKRFRFGPMEWVWRSLTYGKPQPMRRQ